VATWGLAHALDIHMGVECHRGEERCGSDEAESMYPDSGAYLNKANIDEPIKVEAILMGVRKTMQGCWQPSYLSNLQPLCVPQMCWQ
jgi:hypothetical protein